MPRPATVLLLLFALCGALAPAIAQLRGHGGPVRAVAVSPDGSHAITGSFDATAILWSLSSATAERVLRFHDSAVNAVAFIDDGRIATGGEDASIAVWKTGAAKPELIFKGHTAPIVALAVSPDRRSLASASWDGTARLWSLADGAVRALEGHRQNVNGVAFTPDGRFLVTVGYDLTLRIWPLAGSAPPTVATLPAPLNAVAVAPDGQIVAAGASGKLYVLSAVGTVQGEIEAAEAPVIAIAISRDGKLVAAPSVRGTVAIIDITRGTLERQLVVAGFPVWSAAFLPDNRTLLTGGGDNLVQRWDTQTGERIGEAVAGSAGDPLSAYGSDPGAKVFRACVACHTLKADEGRRAGPTLAGIFGRRIATQPGYDFSPALRKLDIVWTPETLSKLFEIGPAAYTPGTKMPEQKVSADDRAALVRFLQKATQR